MPEKRVTVIIPAYNEEKTIGDTVCAARRIDGVTRVIVADDGSVDKTAYIASLCGAVIISQEKNSGKGAAINSCAEHIDGDIVLLLDADLGHSATEAAKLLEPLINGSADMTVAVFPAGVKKSGFGLLKGFARAGIRHYTGISTEAPLSGQRAIDARVFLDLLPLAPGFGVEVDLTVKAGRKGCRIIEVPVKMQHRYTGRNIAGFLHRGRQFWDVTKAFLGHKKVVWK